MNSEVHQLSGLGEPPREPGILSGWCRITWRGDRAFAERGSEHYARVQSVDDCVPVQIRCVDQVAHFIV
jgi:hypothetical protein